MPTPASLSPRPSQRRRLITPVLAAAAVTAILGVGAWQAGLGESGTVDNELVPAAPEGVHFSQSADTLPPGSRVAVIDVAERLTAFSTKPGFGKVDVNYETATVAVFWKGTPPTEVSSLEGERSNGVLILLESATFSEAELIAASNAAMRAGRERFGVDAIAEVHPNNDLSGLVVEATTERVTRDALAEATGGIPVTVRQIHVGEVTCVFGQDCHVLTED